MSEKNKNSPGYKIGQVVYILSNKGQSIIPAMIVEQMTVQTLAGSRVSWKLAMGSKNNPDKPQKVVDSAQINGEIFANLEDVKSALTTKLLQFINKITSDASKRTELWYGDQLKKVSNQNSVSAKPVPGPNDKIDPEDLLEDLDESSPSSSSLIEHGVAHVTSPTRDQSNLPEDAQKADLQNRLKNMASVPEEELSETNEGESRTQMGYIQGPDGQKIPVNLKI